jgi:hypothetical protein
MGTAVEAFERRDPTEESSSSSCFEKSKAPALLRAAKKMMPNLRLADSFETRYDIYSTEE